MRILSIILTVALLGVATTTFSQENKPEAKPERPQVSEHQRGPRGPMMFQGERGGPRGPMFRGQFGPGPRGPMFQGPRGPQFRGGQDHPALKETDCKCQCHKKDGKAQKQGKGRQHRGGRK